MSALQCSSGTSHKGASAQLARLGTGAVEGGGMLRSNYKGWDLVPYHKYGILIGVYKALGTPITIASFCGIVLPRFLLVMDNWLVLFLLYL